MNLNNTNTYLGIYMGDNVFNTTFYAADLMVYLEKYHIMEIMMDIMYLADKERPYCIIEFIAKQLICVERKYNRKIVMMLANEDIDQAAFLMKYSLTNKTPILQYQNPHSSGINNKSALEKLEKFLQMFGIEDKNLIFFNHPKARNELLQMNYLKPNAIFQLTSPNDRYRLECVNNEYIGNYQDLRKYYRAFFGDVFTNQCDLTANSEDILNFCIKLKNRIDHIKIERNFDCGEWVRRIVIIGRRGSGRKVQAALMARQFGMIYIDVEYLVFKYIVLNQCIRDSFLKYKHNSNALFVAAILYRRILKPDCLQNGWVVVGYPNNLPDLHCLMQFITPPNRIVFLHTQEQLCFNRIKKKIIRGNICHQLCNPKYCAPYIKAEFEYYNANIRIMYNYCKDRLKPLICNINGNRSVNSVKSNLWTDLFT